MKQGGAALRVLISLAGVGIISWIAYSVIPVNAATVGFAYLLFILIVASSWGFLESALCSIAATLVFNFFFIDPKLTFTIADPQNWVALFSFLSTSLLAGRLSTRARDRTLEALLRQQDLERLYTFGRDILLIGDGEPFAKQLATKLAATFELDAAALYEPSSGEIYRAGPLEFEGMDTQLREAALQGTVFADPQGDRVIIAVRLGSQPIASLALQGRRMPDSVLQSIGNLVAIGLERAKAQELAHEVEVTRRSERLRATLIDAMAHEFKTPLTSIRAATSALLDRKDLQSTGAVPMLKIADEEATRLEEIIDNALDMAQLEGDRIALNLEAADLNGVVRELVSSMKNEIEGRRMEFELARELAAVEIDRRLMKLAIKQVLNNALKYSPANEPIAIKTSNGDGKVTLDIVDRGKGIPVQEQGLIFKRFFRSLSVQDQTPGSGLGLSIAQRIAEAHQGGLTVTSRPGETTFCFMLPIKRHGGAG